MVKQQRTRLQISERALIQRINRKLKQEGRLGQQLKTARGSNVESSVGRYFIVDIERNIIVAQHVNLEELARELRVLQGWEQL